MSDKLPDKLQAKITSEALLTDQNYIQTIEFMDHPSPRFWGITLPPEDWNPAERKRAQPRSSCWSLFQLPRWPGVWQNFTR